MKKKLSKIFLLLGIIIIIGLFSQCTMPQTGISNSNNKAINNLLKAPSTSYGILPSNVGASDIQDAYNAWKQKYIEFNSNNTMARVKWENGQENLTVSEGIGYGMIFTAIMGDQNIFDGLWAYYKNFPDPNGLMHWKIDKFSTVVAQNAATDAELDCAFALVVAAKKWGSSSRYNYNNEASWIIGKIKNLEVESGTYVLKPGDMFGGSNTTNISYYAPAYYKIFGEFTNDTSFWNNVVDKCYEVIANNQSVGGAVGGLVSDWCKADGSNCGKGYDYSYDACRTPWRISLDYYWYNDTRAKAYLNKTNQFISDIGGIDDVVDGYKINGTVTGQWHNSTYVATFACAGIALSNQSTLNGYYSELKSIAPYSYFDYNFDLFGKLFLGGGYINPMGGGSSSSSSTSSSSSSSSSSTPRFNIPGTIQAEDYHNYYDTTPGNTGGKYRNDDVDIQNCNEGGYNVGWIANNEWLEYNVDVESSGNYLVEVRVAALSNNIKCNILQGTGVIGSINSPATGNWQSWKTESVQVSLSGGNRTIRIAMTGGNWNLNWIKITKVNATPIGPSGYTYCCMEGESYTFTDTVDVAYGANGQFKYESGVTGTITFNNARFTDPIPGIRKSGFYKLSSTSSSSSSSSTSSSGSYTAISFPFTHEGAGEYYWKLSTTPNYINSWNTDLLEINGVNLTNLWKSGSNLPPKQGGYYYIHFKGSVGWSHFEAK